MFSVSLADAEEKAEALHIAEEENKKYEEMLKPLLELYQKGDAWGIQELISKDEYQELSADLKVGGEESHYYGAYDEAGNREGLGVAVYYSFSYASIKSVFYIGEWKKGERDGSAYWAAKGYCAIVNWAEDQPNGKAEMHICDPNDTIEQKKRDWEEVISCNVVNGLYDGEMVIKYSDGLFEYVQYVEGELQIFGTYTDSVTGDVYYRTSKYSDGKYGSVKGYSKKKRGILGFADRVM